MARRRKDVTIPFCSALVRPQVEVVRCPECLMAEERMRTVFPTLKNRRLGKTLPPSVMTQPDSFQRFTELKQRSTDIKCYTGNSD